jgi:hypothetical protein
MSYMKINKISKTCTNQKILSVGEKFWAILKCLPRVQQKLHFNMVSCSNLNPLGFSEMMKCIEDAHILISPKGYVLIHVLLYPGRMLTFLSDCPHLSRNAECPTSSSHCRGKQSLLHSEWSSPAAPEEKVFPVITWWSSSGDPRSFIINVYDYHVWYDCYSLRQQILSDLPHKLR